MTPLEEVLRALQAVDVLANAAIILIGLETLRQRDRVTRVEMGLDAALREFANSKRKD